MKRILSLVLIFTVLVAIGMMAQDTTTAPAATSSGNDDSLLQEKTLIDFANLDSADVSPEIEFNKWRIVLSGLSDNSTSRILSDLRITEVNSGDLQKDQITDEEFSFSRSLGVRINFAKGYNNDWAQIQTENPISEFRVQSEEGEGVLRNVGPVEEISVLVRGMNYMHSLEVRMKDQDGRYRNVNFGGLYFNGWRRLAWKNPDYIADKRKRDIVKVHLYPAEKPMLKFDSLVLYKSPNEKGGDFVCYIKEIKVKYEPFFTRDVDEIDHEGLWGIHEAADNAKQARENQYRFLKYSGSNMEEEYLKEEEARKNQ